LRKLGESKLLGRAYLAGGTALALHIGHRVSYDMDFFTQEVFDEQVMLGKLNSLREFAKDQVSWRTVLGVLGGVKFSIFYYEYPLVDKTVEFEGLQIVTPKDISAMKLLAISDRGARRDFVDLYFMREMFTLEQVFEWYGQKFGNLEERRYHLLRGLNYFEDAEQQDMPIMFQPVNWDDVKKHFENEVLRLNKLWKI
jgi:hypothetical protein